MHLDAGTVAGAQAPGDTIRERGAIEVAGGGGGVHGLQHETSPRRRTELLRHYFVRVFGLLVAGVWTGADYL